MGPHLEGTHASLLTPPSWYEGFQSCTILFPETLSSLSLISLLDPVIFGLLRFVLHICMVGDSWF